MFTEKNLLLASKLVDNLWDIHRTLVLRPVCFSEKVNVNKKLIKNGIGTGERNKVSVRPEI
jgi:hypothetical protein